MTLFAIVENQPTGKHGCHYNCLHLVTASTMLLIHEHIGSVGKASPQKVDQELRVAVPTTPGHSDNLCGVLI